MVFPLRSTPGPTHTGTQTNCSASPEMDQGGEKADCECAVCREDTGGTAELSAETLREQGRERAEFPL